MDECKRKKTTADAAGTEEFIQYFSEQLKIEKLQSIYQSINQIF